MKLSQIGCGYWGKNLMRVFSDQKDAEMVLCCEKDPKICQSLQVTYPTVQVCDDYDTLLKRDDIDAVIIATPAGSHYEQTKLALHAEKHVFVEKPLARNVEEATELVEIAKAKNLILMVGHTFLYNDAVRWVKNYIDSGELGEVYYAYFQRMNLGRVRDDVNAMWNLAPHDVSIAQYWYGEIPSRVEAHGICYLQDGIDDVNFMNLYFESGRFAHIHVSWLDPFKTRNAVVIGSKKMVFYNDASPDQKVTIFDKGIDRKHITDNLAMTEFQDFGQFNLIHRAGDITIPKINCREPLQVEAQHFVECLKNGSSPITDGKNGLDVVRTLEIAQESINNTNGAAN